MPTILQPQRRESGLDKFLKVVQGVGGVANLVSSGFDIYDKYKKNPLERRILEEQEKQMQQDRELAPMKLEQASIDKELDRQAKMAQIEGSAFDRRMRAQERKDAIEAKKQEKADTELAKKKTSLEEVDYRTQSLNSSLNALEDLVKKKGTFELFGPESEQMDSLIFNAALDYAKLVDPQSVAREGEVIAAKKYSLPIKGLGISNESALSLIKDMKEKVNERSAQLKQSKGLGDLIKGNPGKIDLSQKSDEELRAIIGQ